MTAQGRPPSDPSDTAPPGGGVVDRVVRSSMLGELRRRRVPQVAASYAAISWGIVQLSTTVFPLLNLPASSPRIVLLLLIVGFPIMLFLAWTFDITPHGIRPAGASTGVAPVPMSMTWRIAWTLISVAMVAGGVWLVKARPAQVEAADKSSALMLTAVAAPPVTGSIAVLPFDNIPADTATEYFADGMTDDVIAALARIGTLRVTSRTSVMQYKEARQNVRDIAQKLGVRNVIEGSIRRIGNRVHINVQLVDAQADHMVWSEQYDRELDNVFAIQSEIAQKVAGALNASVMPAEAAELSRSPTASITAYDIFLKARDLSFANRPEERSLITRLLRQALELDPRYADVYVYLAVSFQQRYFDGGSMDKRFLDSALVYSRKALALDSTAQMAHFTMARVYNSQQDPRYKEEFRKGIALNPNTRDALWAAAGLADQDGRYDESLRYLRQLLAREPDRPMHYAVLGDNYMALGLYDDARVWLQKALEMQPNLWPAHAWMVHLLLSTGKVAEAETQARELLGLELGGNRGTVWMVRVLMRKGDYRASVPYVEDAAFDGEFERAFVYHKLGQRSKEAKALDDIEARLRSTERRGGNVPTIEAAEVAFLRGDKEAGYRALERALDGEWLNRDDERQTFTEAYFPELKQEARFQSLQQKVDARLAAMRQRVRAESL